jgi:hypothetical protein
MPNASSRCSRLPKSRAFRGYHFANACNAVHVQHLCSGLTSFGQVNDRVHSVFDLGNPSYRLKRLHRLRPVVLIRGSINNSALVLARSMTNRQTSIVECGE